MIHRDCGHPSLRAEPGVVAELSCKESADSTGCVARAPARRVRRPVRSVVVHADEVIGASLDVTDPAAVVLPTPRLRFEILNAHAPETCTTSAAHCELGTYAGSALPKTRAATGLRAAPGRRPRLWSPTTAEGRMGFVAGDASEHRAVATAQAARVGRRRDGRDASDVRARWQCAGVRRGAVAHYRSPCVVAPPAGHGAPRSSCSPRATTRSRHRVAFVPFVAASSLQVRRPSDLSR
jgi:hypothetical protein